MCDHHNLDPRITPPREGEQYFLNSQGKLDDETCERINHFIKICRNYVKMKDMLNETRKEELSKFP